MFSTLSFHASSQASPSLINVKSTNPRVFFKHVFLMSVLLWGKFHWNLLLRYTQAKHSLPGNRVLEVSLDLWPEIIPDWESSFFAKPELMSDIWLALAPTITCCRSHERLSRSLFVFGIAEGQNKEQRYLSFSLLPRKHRISGLALLMLSSERLLAFISGFLRSGAERLPVLPHCCQRFGQHGRGSGPRVCK